MKNLQLNNIKNIWILNHYAITPDMPGGTRHYDFGKELVKRGYKVIIFASGFHYSQHKELKLTKNEKYKIENVDGINFVWIKTFPYQRNDWRRVLNTISYMHRVYWLGRKILKINQNIKKPDIFIGSTVHLLTVLSTYWLSKYYKTKFIMEVRDLWPQTLIDTGKIKKDNLIAKILRILERFLYKKAEKIIILSPLTKKYLLNLNIKESKIYLIPNGVDITRYKIVSVEMVDKKKKDNFKIMYTGVIGSFIGLEYILRAAKIIQEKGFENIKFILVGDGVEKTKLIEKSKKLKLTNVKFLNSVPKNKIPFVLNTADISLLVTNKVLYGSENKLMDYMASAQPIIFSTLAKHNTVQRTNCGISVLPQDSRSLVKAIITLCQMPFEERRKMGQRGREYVEKYHSIPILVDKLEKVIQEVINE